MIVAEASPLVAWNNFYVIVGSAAAALIGLMFVAMTLNATQNRRSDVGTKAFSTPTIVHFGTVLVIAAILCAPWPSLGMVELLFAAGGLGGIIYTAVNIWRIWHQQAYKPVIEDWAWYATVPFAAYAALGVAVPLLMGHPMQGLFVVGGVSIVLLLTGIHNAWDIVTYVAVTLPHQD